MTLLTQQPIRLAAIATLSGITVALAYCYLHYPLGYNQGIYHYTGMLLRDGGLPYRDVIDRKGPAGLLVYALAAPLFGTSDLGYRIFDLIVMTGIAMLLYRLARREFGEVLSLSVLAVWFGHVLLDGPGNTGDVTNLIVLATVAFATFWNRADGRSWLAGGLSISLAFWVKPTAVLIFLPLILWHGVRRRSWRNLIMLCGGFFAVSAVVVLGLVALGIWSYFYEVVILDTLTHYVPSTQLSPVHNFYGLSTWLLADPIFRLVGLAGLFLFKSGDDSWRTLRWLALGVGLMVVVESRFFPYHFSPLLPLLAIGCGRMVTEIWKKVTQHNWQLISSAAFIAVLLMQPVVLLARDLPTTLTTAPDSKARATLFQLQDLRERLVDRLEIVGFLRGALGDDTSLFLLAGDLNIYLDLDRLAPCRHANPPYVLYGYDPETASPHRRRWREEIVGCLMQTPDWLVISRDLQSNLDAEMRSNLDQIISDDYELTFEQRCYLTYRRTNGGLQTRRAP